MKAWSIAAILAVLVPPAAFAQSRQAQTHQPYAGMEAREIKALSPQQIADLKAGRGMGLALPAELNGYPGPAHVLELAAPLGLSDEQRTRVAQLFDAMKAEAVPLGEELIAREAALDRLFADRKATVESIAAATLAIGETEARLRTAHLRYHLSTLELLAPAQVERYAELRGYAAGAPRLAPHQHH